MSIFSLVVGLLLAVVTILYLRGWVRLRRRSVAFASLPRLMVFGFAVVLTATVFLSPLNWFNQVYFSIRVAQYVLLCLFAVPAFFISCTFDIALWGLPASTRRAVARWMRSRSALRRAIRTLTRPWIVLFFFIALLVSWFDMRTADLLLAHSEAHTASLLVLGAGAMLVWWHLIGTGPRLHTEFSPWLAAAALLLLELVSMSTAVPLVFSTAPAYAHYAAIFPRPVQISIIDDQVLGGGLLWVGGSAVFLSSIVLILNRLFDRHGMNGSDPLPDWDADERMIMPGLEHRVKK